MARTLLKAMASPAGERVFVGASQLARPAGAELSDVQAVLDALLNAGLLEPRPMPDGAVAYSLGHQVLAAEVQGWSDPEKARDRCAEATLKRDWEAWYEEWYVTRRQGPTAADVIGLLVPADHLREIRARRPGVTVGAPQLCLLLQSAVRHRCDMAYWARELAGSKAALDLLEQIHDGPAAEAPRDARPAVELGAEALGIGQTYVGRQGLARAAVAYGRSTRGDGAVRHTAALALAALAGKTLRLDTVDEALATLHEAAPMGSRRTQALAQMKAAGFRLPERTQGGRSSVDIWAFGLALWEQFWPIVTEAAAAGLGAALGLSLCLLISTLLLSSGDPDQVIGYAFRGFILQPIGLVLGMMAVAGRASWRWPWDAGTGARFLGGSSVSGSDSCWCSCLSGFRLPLCQPDRLQWETADGGLLSDLRRGGRDLGAGHCHRPGIGHRLPGPAHAEVGYLGWRPGRRRGHFVDHGSGHGHVTSARVRWPDDEGSPGG